MIGHIPVTGPSSELRPHVPPGGDVRPPDSNAARGAFLEPGNGIIGDYRERSGLVWDMAGRMKIRRGCVCRESAQARRGSAHLPRVPNRPGLHPWHCVPFCVPPRSRMVACGSSRAGVRIAATSAENQHHSEPSHSVSVVFGRPLNQRVPGSSPGRLTISLSMT